MGRAGVTFHHLTEVSQFGTAPGKAERRSITALMHLVRDFLDLEKL